MKDSIWILLVVALFTTSCRIDGNKKISEDDLNFSTTDDSELFFKNVRQLYYDLEEFPEANLNIYRFKGRLENADYPTFNVAIVWNWLKDEAYILVEPNEFLVNEDPILVFWEDPINGHTGTFTYESGNIRAQLNFATELYNGIIDNYRFEISLSNSKVPFFENHNDRESFRKTLSDYFRLTGTF